MIMHLKGCSEEYARTNPVNVKYRKSSTQAYIGEEGPSEITREIVSEDEVVWYGVEGLVEAETEEEALKMQTCELFETFGVEGGCVKLFILVFVLYLAAIVLLLR